MAKFYFVLALASTIAFLFVGFSLIKDKMRMAWRPMVLNDFFHAIRGELNNNENYKSLDEIIAGGKDLSLETIYASNSELGLSNLETARKMKSDGFTKSQILESVEPPFKIGFLGDRWFVYENPRIFDASDGLLIQMDDGTGSWVSDGLLQSLGMTQGHR
ncbi:hypothetical protein [Puniceicoccus vermicola]